MAAKKTKKTTKKKTTAKKPKTKKAAAKKTKAPAKTKKAVAKKTAAKKKTRKKRKTKLSAAQIRHFKELLLLKYVELTGNVNAIEKEALKTSRLDAAGDLSSMPIHMADMGTDNFEQEFALDLMDSERKLLAEIYAALDRIEHHTFGICEGTGKPIKLARLQACPWSRYCIEYATMVEKGLITEGEKIADEDEEYDDIEDDDTEDDIKDDKKPKADELQDTNLEDTSLDDSRIDEV